MNKSIGPISMDTDSETNLLCVITHTADEIFQFIGVYKLTGRNWLHIKSYFYLEVGVSYIRAANYRRTI